MAYLTIQEPATMHGRRWTVDPDLTDFLFLKKYVRKHHQGDPDCCMGRTVLPRKSPVKRLHGPSYIAVTIVAVLFGCMGLLLRQHGPLHEMMNG